MKMITIMPDFGNGPYAWIKDASDDTTYVGGNIADAVDGFKHSGYKVSAAIEADFAAWMMLFGNYSDSPAFDWPAFHRQGIALTKRLKAELGDRVRIVYDTQVEDPSYAMDARSEVRTEILDDGSLRPIMLCRVAHTE
jgi:hypothetical protein